jgi:hypothetical protein
MNASRHTLSYVFFVLAVILLLLFGLVANNWLWGALLGLAGLLVGFLFYRRGR